MSETTDRPQMDPDAMLLRGRDRAVVARKRPILHHHVEVRRFKPRAVGQTFCAHPPSLWQTIVLTIQQQRGERARAITRPSTAKPWRAGDGRRQPKATTTNTKERGEEVKDVERSEHGPGTNSFLATAMRRSQGYRRHLAGKDVKYHRSCSASGRATRSSVGRRSLSKLNDEEFARVVSIAKGIAHDTIRKHRSRSGRRNRNGPRSRRGTTIERSDRKRKR